MFVSSTKRRAVFEVIRAMRSFFYVGIVIVLLVFDNWVSGSEASQYHYINETELSLLEAREASVSLVGMKPLMVGLTLIQGAAAKGAGTV